MLLQIYLLDYTMKHLLLLHSEFIFPIAPELYELLLLDLRQYSDFFFFYLFESMLVTRGKTFVTACCKISGLKLTSPTLRFV